MRRMSLAQQFRIITAIGWSDFILKYRGSILGYLWSLISPLVKFLVILAAFGPYVSPSIPQYPLYLFLGIIIWEHFMMTTGSCMRMLAEKGQIIRHLSFPRLLLIFAVGWTNFIVFMTHFLIFLLFAWSRGAALTPPTFLLLLTIVQMSLFALGIGMMLSSYCLKYRDLPHLWGIITQILFWMTPIMYPSHRTGTVITSIVTVFQGGPMQIAHRLFPLFTELQPLSLIIQDARRAALYPVSVGVPSPIHIAGVTVACGIVFLAGVWIFRRRSPFFPQEY